MTGDGHAPGLDGADVEAFALELVDEGDALGADVEGVGPHHEVAAIPTTAEEIPARQGSHRGGHEGGHRA